MGRNPHRAYPTRSAWPRCGRALLAVLLLGAVLGCQAVWAKAPEASAPGQEQLPLRPAEVSGPAAPAASAVDAQASAAASESLSDAETLAFLGVLALFPLSVLAIRWLTQRQIQRLMNVDSREQLNPQGFRHHATTAEVPSRVPVQFQGHDAQHVDAQAAQAREVFVSRSLTMFRRAVLLDVVAGVVYVLFLGALGLTSVDTDSRSDLTLGFTLIGLLYPALAGLRYGVYRRQFRPKDTRFRRSWLVRIPMVAWLRELISPRFQAALAGGWAAVMLVTGLGLASESAETAAHRVTGALLAAVAVLHVLLAWRVLRRLQCEPGVRLLVLRVFGIDANASFTFGRVLAFWQHFGNHFTVLDPSIWRHRFPLMSWRTGGFMLLVALLGFFALGAVLQNPAWEAHAFAITGGLLLLLLGVYAAFTQLLLRREFIRSRPQLLKLLDRLEQRPRHLDLSFRHLAAMCHNNTWQLAVDEFARRSQALLMDLRGFSNERKGCQSEVDFLLDTVPLRQVVFLVDAGGDHALVQQMIEQRWAMLSPDSPNLHDAAPRVHIYVSQTSDEADVQGILDLLILAAQSGSQAAAGVSRSSPPALPTLAQAA